MDDRVTRSPEWASFREVVEQMVRGPLAAVQSRVDERLDATDDATARLTGEVRGAHEGAVERLRQLEDGQQRHTELTQYLARGVRDVTNQLEQLRELTRQVADRQQALATAAAALRAGVRVLTVAIGILLAVSVLVLLAVAGVGQW